MKKIFESIALWLLIVVFIVVLFSQVGGIPRGGVELSFGEFLDMVEKGKVSNVVINPEGKEVEGKLADGSSFHSNIMVYPNLVDELKSHGVSFEVSTGEGMMNFFAGLLISWFPMFLLIGVWVFFMRQMQSGSNKTMSFGKSKARLISNKANSVTFKDVAGVDEAKEELAEIVEFLKYPAKFQLLGGKIPKGCLLIGSPGTGKTLLGRAIAGEANVPFFIISGSDFVEMFVGVGASRVRDMFERGKKNAPCIIFIDEIDAVGRHRGIGLGGGNDEREQTLNQLLVEMDGFESNEGVIILAATNRPDVLDPALLRPGRFDRRVVITPPDIAGREEILSVHTSKVPIAPDVIVRTIARGTPGFSGADLANLVNESSLIAARRNKKVVTMEDFEYARDKVMMGAERRSMIMKDEEKKLTAYHEAGHAITSLHMPASDPIHKATIIPRGRSLGLVMRLPEHDRVSLTREKMLADVVVAMGGRAAEEIIFGHDKVTSGASSDIKQSTSLARSMVTKWGMSEAVGPICYLDDDNGQGHDSVSNDTANLVDSEVKRIIECGLEQAREILSSNLENLHLLAKTLLEFETLTGDEIKALLDGTFDSENKRKPKDDTGETRRSSME